MSNSMFVFIIGLCLTCTYTIQARPVYKDTVSKPDQVESNEPDEGIYFVNDDAMAGAPGAVDEMLRSTETNVANEQDGDQQSMEEAEGNNKKSIDRSCLKLNENGYPSCFFDAFNQQMDCDVTDCRQALSSKTAKDMLWTYEGQQYRCVTWDPDTMKDDSAVGDVCGCPLDNPLIVPTSGFITDMDERMASGKVKFQRCGCVKGYTMKEGSCIKNDDIGLSSDVSFTSNNADQKYAVAEPNNDSGEEIEDDGEADIEDDQADGDVSKASAAQRSNSAMNLAERSRASAYKRKGEHEALQAVVGMLKNVCVDVTQKLAADIETLLAKIRPTQDVASPCIVDGAPDVSQKEAELVITGEDEVEDRVAGFDMAYPKSPITNDVTKHTSKVMNVPNDGQKLLQSGTDKMTTMTPAGLRFVQALFVKHLSYETQCSAGATSISSIASVGAKKLFAGEATCGQGELYKPKDVQEAIVQLHQRLDKAIRNAPGSKAPTSAGAGDVPKDMTIPMTPGCDEVLYDPSGEVDIINGKRKGDDNAGKAKGMAKNVDAEVKKLPNLGAKSVESEWAVANEDIAKTLLKPPQAEM